MDRCISFSAGGIYSPIVITSVEQFSKYLCNDPVSEMSEKEIVYKIPYYFGITYQNVTN